MRSILKMDNLSVFDCWMIELTDRAKGRGKCKWELGNKSSSHAPFWSCISPSTTWFIWGRQDWPETRFGDNCFITYTYTVEDPPIHVKKRTQRTRLQRYKHTVGLWQERMGNKSSNNKWAHSLNKRWDSSSQSAFNKTKPGCKNLICISFIKFFVFLSSQSLELIGIRN